MSDQELSEDMLNWPQHAHELLGLDQNADERALKRAYTRLIRRFKPDHHPQQFARIRAAYEELQQRIAWRAQFFDEPADDLLSLEQLTRSNPSDQDNSGPPVVEHDAPPAQSDTHVSAEASNSTHTSGSARSLGHGSADDVDAVWKAACDGNSADAYRRLVALHDRQRGDEDICVRLYWLLRLIPDLDLSKDCTEWLIASLQKNLQGSAWYLYREELRRRPELIDAPGNVVLHSTRTSASQLLYCFSIRWRAAADLQRWSLIQTDLDKLREVVLDGAASTWAGMLFEVADLAAWSQDDDARKLFLQCIKELGEHTDLQLELSHAYERLDILFELSSVLFPRRGQAVSQLIVAVLRAHWLNDYAEIRPLSQLLLEDWVQNPAVWLRWLDKMRADRSLVLYQLKFALQQLSISDSVRDDEAQRVEMWELISKFLMRKSNSSYVDFRYQLLEFCVELRITLAEVQEVLPGLPPKAVSVSLETLAADLPLELLLLGISAFWSR